MKTTILGLLVLGLACSACATDRAQLDDRVASLTEKFTAMEQNPATRVPAGELAQAQGIVLLDRTRGALFLGFHSGNGMALVRNASGGWSPAGFVSSVGASLGPQIGGTRDFYIVLLMSPASVETLKQPVMDFGAQASGTAGSRHTGAEASMESHPSVLVYGERNGLYAGASLKGGSVKADKDANAVYYGHPVSMDEILFGHEVPRSPAEDNLTTAIDRYSR
ncbi:MAG TPA: lipid-binding SYLF domain-containing protein [Verrucomicrobiae bacterium]|nr:lipid-binding SYLF domain-containing protein [Verrucomicrobiae bacterium]